MPTSSADDGKADKTLSGDSKARGSEDRKSQDDLYLDMGQGSREQAFRLRKPRLTIVPPA